MTDFEDRIKRAAQQLTQKSKAEEQANTSREEARKNFLLNFWEKGKHIIEPVLDRAKEHVDPAPTSHFDSEWSDEPRKKKPRPVGASVSWSENEDRITFMVTYGSKYTALVFVVNPLTLLVRVSSDSMSVSDRGDYKRLLEVQDGTGRNATRVAELTLDQIDRASVEEYVAAFLERCTRP